MEVVAIIYIRKQVGRKDLHRMKQLTTKTFYITRMVSRFFKFAVKGMADVSAELLKKII
jgi:hypothetical protein